MNNYNTTIALVTDDEDSPDITVSTELGTDKYAKLDVNTADQELTASVAIPQLLAFARAVIAVFGESGKP